MRKRFNFEIGDTIWYAYIVTEYNVDKNGVRNLSSPKSLDFTLPLPSIYLQDEIHTTKRTGNQKKTIILSDVNNNKKKIMADSFNNAFTILKGRLSHNDKKYGTNLISKMINMFPDSPYFETNPEWFV